MAYGIAPNLLYARTHEWVRLEADGHEAVMGVSDVAQQLLSDVVFVELPEVGTTFEQNDTCCTVESVKAAEEVFMPLSGTVTEVNAGLVNNPELVNTDPYNQAWFLKFKPSNLETEKPSLMDATQYRDFTDTEVA